MKHSMARGRRFFNELRRSNVFLLLLLLVMVGGFVSMTKAQQPSGSVEVGFTELSPNGETGGQTVPASCNGGPNDPNYGYGCSAGNQCGTNYGTFDTCGNCSVGGPYVPPNWNASCSGSNVCGTLYGNITCGGTCSVGGPTTYGTCYSAANACGQTNAGTSCGGASCVDGNGAQVQTPAVPAGYGQACVSSPNSCGQTNTGTIQCSGACSASAPANTSCPPTINVNPQTPTIGQTVTISWSCPGNTSATGTNFSTANAPSGQATVTVNTTTTYTVNCVQTGTQVSTTATIVPPTLSLTASPTRVKTNNASNLTWAASNVTSCTLAGPGVNVTRTAVSGVVSQQVTSTGAITGQSNYTLSCQTSGAPASTSITINLIPNSVEI